LSVTVFERMPLDQVLTGSDPATSHPSLANQLTLFDY